jgi:hypothetical protein
MKRILSTICIGSLALALAALAANDENKPTGKGKGSGKGSAKQSSAQTTSKATNRTVHNSGQVKTSQHHVNTAKVQQNHHASAQTTNSSAVVHKNKVQTNRNQGVSNATVKNTKKVSAHNDVTVNRSANFNTKKGQNLNAKRSRNVTITNNWRGQSFSGNQYAAFRNYHRQSHNQNWWRSHYNRLTFFGGGWYFWNSGYWYPAWGYNSGYNYPYDGPIYGYNNLSPDRVVVNVQSQLQRDGYYNGPIDGVLGRNTRQAIAAFQADHGLAVTSSVDEPTLATLGLV